MYVHVPTESTISSCLEYDRGPGEYDYDHIHIGSLTSFSAQETTTYYKYLKNVNFRFELECITVKSTIFVLMT